MQIHHKSRLKPLARLRTRMAFSYVAVTLVIVLMLETLVFTVIFYGLTRSPFLGYLAQTRADSAARILALQAAVQAEDTVLNPDTTFKPGQPNSISLGDEEDNHPQFSYWNMSVPYLESGTITQGPQIFALLIGPGNQVLASSYPDRYPVFMDLARELPEDLPLIQSALEGKSDSMLRETSQGRIASVARTIWSRDQKPLGVIYIQMPAGGPPDPNLIPELTSVLIPSALVWLCLMLPVGLLFGFLTTRGLIRRIERLADATAKFANGDKSQRVPVSRSDEIGQLEGQFNQMAEQLIDSFEQQQVLTEQSARREERARIEQELTSAFYVQQSLLPEHVPSFPGCQIEPFYLPAREVGGDLYDFLLLPDGCLGIVIGDANGKGMPAALIMATTSAMVRAAAPGTASPGEVLALVNNLLQANIPPQTFATCFYAILDPDKGRLTFANAGHNLPYLARDGETLELKAIGMPLGLMPEQDYPEVEAAIAPGEFILFYTDGLVEAHDPDRKMLGSTRLKRLIQEHPTADGLIEFLMEELNTFTGPEWEQEDDITLVLLRKTA